MNPHAPVLRLCLALGTALLPTFLVLLVLRYKRQQWAAKTKAPFDELRRRPAGEGLREKLEQFDETILEKVMGLFIVPYLAGVMFGWGPPVKGALIITILFSTAWSGFFGWRLYRQIRDRADYQLGYDGERFVGEELNRLVAHEFDVYHDVQFKNQDREYNIDHVLVGPPGVFCIETKTRRKPVTQSGAKQFRVTFDGTSLHWPMGRDEYGVQQTINNARTLSQWLSGATGDPVHVTPILTLPGWLVDYTADPRRAKVQVMNPKQILDYCTTLENRLDPNHLDRMRYQLDRNCKLNLFGPQAVVTT